MRIYISADMEGASGISCPDYVLTDGRLYAAGQRLLTEDVNAAVRGAMDAGADEVVVADMHGTSGHILAERLDPRALLLAGTPHQPRFPFLDRDTDGMFLLCYHAMAGTAMACLEHTMSSRQWHCFRVNGTPYGEFGIDAEIAAECGVPVVMTSGDDKLCAEAAQWLNGVETACVKQGLGRQCALCLSPAEGQKRVYEAARRAVCRLLAGEHFAIPATPSPAKIAITYKMMPDADAANTFGTRRLDGYTVEWEHDRLSHFFGGIWADRPEKRRI